MMSLRIHYDLYGSIALHCLLSTETQGLLCGNRFNLEKEVYPPSLAPPLLCAPSMHFKRLCCATNFSTNFSHQKFFVKYEQNLIIFPDCLGTYNFLG